jgi:glutamyl-tRNA(Gln) amidotransferase subunit E
LLVELDEEPPHEINKEALKIALQIALLLNCQFFPVTQVMRKNRVNGITPRISKNTFNCP